MDSDSLHSSCQAHISELSLYNNIQFYYDRIIQFMISIQWRISHTSTVLTALLLQCSQSQLDIRQIKDVTMWRPVRTWHIVYMSNLQHCSQATAQFLMTCSAKQTSCLLLTNGVSVSGHVTHSNSNDNAVRHLSGGNYWYLRRQLYQSGNSNSYHILTCPKEKHLNVYFWLGFRKKYYNIDEVATVLFSSTFKKEV